MKAFAYGPERQDKTQPPAGISDPVGGCVLFNIRGMGEYADFLDIFRRIKVKQYLPQDKDKTVCKIFHLLPIHFVCYNLAIEVMMVQEHGFIIFFQIMLDEYFISKKKMAQTLDVSLRTLQYNFKRIKLKKGGCMALTNLFLYCYENEISVDQIYRRYQNLDRSSIKGDGKMSHSGMMKWMYIFASRSTNQYGSS